MVACSSLVFVRDTKCQKKNKLKFDNPKLCCVNFIDVDEINT